MKSSGWVQKRVNTVRELYRDLRDQCDRRGLKTQEEFRNSFFIDSSGTVTDMTIAERIAGLCAELDLMRDLLY